MENTIFMGKVAIHLPEIDSTNVFAKELLSKSTPIEGTVIYADHQTAGKGQIGSQWHSPVGQNLLSSWILYPKFLPADQLFLLNQAVSLALYDTLREQVPEHKRVSIKWPNDIYIDDKKVSGVLIENQLRGFFVQHTVVGIGINVLQTAFDPALPNPTSLTLENPEKKFSISTLLFQLASNLERQYIALRSNRGAFIQGRYLDCLYRYQEWAYYLSKEVALPFEARIVGVDEAGRLQLEHKDGKKTVHEVKSVRFL